LKFPTEQEYALGRLTIEINDDIIEGKILKKEKAQEKYEDAIASGHTAVMAEEEKDEPDMVNLKVGNLLAGQEAVVRFRLLHVLRVECGAYVVRVPMSFFPASEADYAYTFRTEIKAESPIVYVSVPENAVAQRSTENPCQVLIERSPQSGLTVIKDLEIYYRTANMDAPALIA